MANQKIKEDIIAEITDYVIGLDKVSARKDYESTLKGLIDILKQNEKIAKIYHEDTDQMLFVYSSIFLNNLFTPPEKSRNEILLAVTNFYDTFTQEKEYTAIIWLEGLLKLPIGQKIGQLEIIEPNFNDLGFIGQWVNLTKIITINTPQRQLDFNIYNWCKITFKTFNNLLVSDELSKELELPFAIISLFTNANLDTKELIGFVFESKNGIFNYRDSPKVILNSVQYRGYGSYGTYKDENTQHLKSIQAIIEKGKKGDMDNRIIRSLRLFGVSRLSYKYENRFLMVVSACESLLLSKDEKDYIAWKLSEKTAFLTRDTGEERLKLYKRMKELYNLRSKLIHEGKEDIKYSDIRELDTVYLELIMRILPLAKTYETMQQTSGKAGIKDGVEDYINTLKYNLM